MNLTIEIEKEEDGRFLAEVVNFPGVLAYGNTKEEAVARVQALALWVLADKLEDGKLMLTRPTEYFLN
ncbi:type II toxin-antitoxin system HicB family antitoxin [Nostoc sp. FACHB-152]|uniref:type II toxin-antitoxin system HicB family antitoxin n=1 Tax=unclassified Nostoc TaxID=2593658 RepID=UPI001682B36D|nr:MULTISPECIES: type II toxin-antitoxin system HicB family antitoxin [unclassified Nostoc]MBD2449830.1 type II toxin-antitoxin system HicB family antitoxin [Nostoc sp. FACHB-152]MBD2471591.1 type II toxin-antitoxin system HicB family antitoxin [Nostoc sp. FACHB-145]